MSESSSRRAKRGSRVQVRGEARPARSQTESATSASLSELRRRAAHRLREIGASLEMVREQYEEAAAECARLQAGGEPAVTRVVAQPKPADHEAGAAAADHAETEHLKAQAEELKRRLDEAATLLATEHARSQKLKGSLREVERELAEARDATETERARRSRGRSRESPGGVAAASGRNGEDIRGFGRRVAHASRSTPDRPEARAYGQRSASG